MERAEKLKEYVNSQSSGDKKKKPIKDGESSKDEEEEGDDPEKKKMMDKLMGEKLYFIIQRKNMSFTKRKRRGS